MPHKSGSYRGGPGAVRPVHRPVDDWPEIDIEAAARRIRPLVRRTPLIEARSLSARLGVPVHLKLETLQATGSFKARGAAARLSLLTEAECVNGVVTCSSGNHGRAVAYVAARLGVPATVCVPGWIDPVKLGALERSGARVDRSAATYDEAEVRAAGMADERGLTLIHPFDDPIVVAGQGTVALEILDRLPDVRTIVAPLSGGGLCGGIALALLRSAREAELVAVSAERAATMLESLDAGKPVEAREEPTVASALSGGIGLENRWTFALVQLLVESHCCVSEDEILAAMRFAVGELRLIVEGGGAVGLAAALKGAIRADGPIAIVLSGGNVDPSALARILAPAPSTAGP